LHAHGRRSVFGLTVNDRRPWPYVSNTRAAGPDECSCDLVIVRCSAVWHRAVSCGDGNQVCGEGGGGRGEGGIDAVAAA